MTTTTRPSAGTASPVRRQARFAAGRAILPRNAIEGTWYNVCAGRRTGDDKPGMVMLDLGGSRQHVPVACLEFRDVPRAAPEPASRHAFPRLRRRAATVALSLLPLGAALLLARVGKS